MEKITLLENENMRSQKDLAKVRTEYNLLQRESGETINTLRKDYDRLQARFSETIRFVEFLIDSDQQ